MNKINCAVCEQNLWEYGIKLAKCKFCGFARANDKYFDIDIKTIYNQSYYNSGDYYNYEIEKPALYKNFEDRLSLIKKYIKTGRLLEIGSAYGYFLELAKNNFKCTGVECDINLAKKISDKLNLQIYAGPFEESKIQDDSQNLIVALDTIEHIKYPDIFIKKCHRILKNDGYLFLETGDIDGFVPKIQKENWRLVHPPEHLSYFSTNTLKLLLEKNGFKVLDVKKVSFYRTLAQTIYRLGIKYNVKLFDKIIFPINTFDLIFFVAQKI